MIKLGVNIDHLATLRELRKSKTPDLLKCALLVEHSGADGITAHLREDRRHIRDEDVFNLTKNIRTRLNLEMALAGDVVKVALKAKPHSVCIVPEKRQELTTEGGLDVVRHGSKLKEVIKLLKGRGIIVSLFVNPQEKQVIAAKAVGAHCVELHTGSYADAPTKTIKNKELAKLRKAGRVALDMGLILNAGHGLDLENVIPITKIPRLNELNIGYSIVCRSVVVGLGEAVREMKRLL